MGTRNRVQCFIDRHAEEEFSIAFSETLEFLQNQNVAQLIDPKNTQRFKHGVSWIAPPTSPSLPASMKEHSASFEARFEDIVNHDLGILPRVIQELSAQMGRQVTELLFSTVQDACEQTGNTVDAKSEGSTEQAFLKMLKKIEFSLDERGELKMPTMHAGSEAFAAFEKMKKNATPEFKAEVDCILAEKKQQAIDHESMRRKQFLQYGDK